LFKQALDEDRPSFVDYFLRIKYDPRRTWILINAKPSTYYRTESTILSDSITAFNSQARTEKDISTELHNQIQLSEQGLRFIFELYENELNLKTWVSIISTTFVKI
jgi:hypothetical protein